MMNEASSLMKGLSMNWEYFSIWKNIILNPLRVLRTTKEFLTLGKAQQMLLHVSLQMLKMQISTQTDNHKYIATKK